MRETLRTPPPPPYEEAVAVPPEPASLPPEYAQTPRHQASEPPSERVSATDPFSTGSPYGDFQRARSPMCVFRLMPMLAQLGQQMTRGEKVTAADALVYYRPLPC